MENENKNLADGGKEATPEKKLNLPLIIGAAVGAVVVIAGIILAVVLLGGGEECRHVDADDNGKCDNCAIDYEDGDEAVVPTKRPARITAVDDKGNTLSGFNFTLTGGGENITFTTDASGSATKELYEGLSYTVELYRPADGSEETDAAYGYTLSTFSVKLAEGAEGVTITLNDNRPDGSLEKPFYVYENTEITVAPGAEIYYECRGSVDSWLEMRGEGFTVTYNGKTLTPEDGLVKLVFELDGGDNPADVKFETFAIKNTGTQSFETVIEFVSRPGSYNNPYDAESDSFTASVVDTVYYQYTVNAAGTLVLTSNSANNNIKLTNNNVVTSYTYGAKGTYIAVDAGDVVKIEISTTDSVPSDIDIALSIHLGTESDPLPVFSDELEIKLDAGASVSYSAEAGKKIVISNANVTVTTGGEVKSPNSLGVITVNVGADGIFTVTNTSAERNEIEIKIS